MQRIISHSLKGGSVGRSVDWSDGEPVGSWWQGSKDTCSISAAPWQTSETRICQSEGQGINSMEAVPFSQLWCPDLPPRTTPPPPLPPIIIVMPRPKARSRGTNYRAVFGFGPGQRPGPKARPGPSEVKCILVVRSWTPFALELSQRAD